METGIFGVCLYIWCVFVYVLCMCMYDMCVCGVCTVCVDVCSRDLTHIYPWLDVYLWQAYEYCQN